MLVADHAPTRIGVRIALGDLVSVCAEADDADGAVAEAAAHQPDVCFVSLELAGGGLEAVRGIRRVAPHTSIVVSAQTPDVDDLLAALRAGAVGYLPAGISADPLRRIVQAVAANEAAVPRNMVIELVRELQSSSDGPEGLTARECQVLGMLRRGHSTASIAERLEIAPVTVRRHISQLVQKFGVADRAALLDITAVAPARAGVAD
jgi:DNA-binding NarL/FixJ family response regulator